MGTTLTGKNQLSSGHILSIYPTDKGGKTISESAASLPSRVKEILKSQIGPDVAMEICILNTPNSLIDVEHDNYFKLP